MGRRGGRAGTLLAGRVLTGKYAPDAPPDKETRAGRADKRMMQTEWRPESLKLAQENLRRNPAPKPGPANRPRALTPADQVVN